MKGRFLRGGHQQSSDHHDHEQYAIGDRHNLQQNCQNKIFPNSSTSAICASTNS